LLFVENAVMALFTVYFNWLALNIVLSQFSLNIPLVSFADFKTAAMLFSQILIKVE
jgi:hypothetical protein